MVKIIIEMLFNGSSPTSVAKDIELTIRLICPSVEIEEPSNADYVRNARVTTYIISKIAAAYKLEKNSEWLRTFCDGSSRSNIALTTFVEVTLNDDMETIHTITLYCSKVVLGDTSEETIESIIDVTEEVKENLFRLVITHMKNYPDEPHEINPPENLI